MSSIIKKAKEYVTDYLSKNLSSDYNFNCINHTFEVARNAEEIGKGSLLKNRELDIVMLAAWFHDVGYSKCGEGHEQISIDIAEDFLIANNYSNEDIEQVKKCIEATKLSHIPKSLVEEILADSDLLHIGKEDYLEKSNLLRQELKKNQNMECDDEEWIEKNIDFMSEHDFYTEYAKKNYGPQRIKNIENLKNQLNNLNEKERHHE